MINSPGIEMVSWQRHRPHDLAHWIDALPAIALPRLRVDVPVTGCTLALHAACHAAGMPDGPLRDAFVGDVAALASHFSRIVQKVQPQGSCLLRPRLRLDVVDVDACRRWHRDCVPLRLLCTYRGPGTEWVPPVESARALSDPDGYDRPSHRLGTHEVAVFKGCGFAGAPTLLTHDSGIVHRSPRIASAGDLSGPLSEGGGALVPTSFHHLPPAVLAFTDEIDAPEICALPALEHG